ncbi:MAG: LytR C-terminal domain-containing protein, partial [Actinomycetota bacterium]
MSTETSSSQAHRDAGWVRPVVLAVSCLVIGFVGGWALRGGESDPIVLPPAAETPAATTTETSTTSTTGTNPVTVTESTPPPPPAPTLPDPAEVILAVLNGSGVTGLAGQTAERATSLGYPGVTAGNAPAQTGPTVVYFRDGQRLAARRVAQDLGYGAGQVRALPADASLAAEAPATAQVIVVLGP